MSFCTIFFFKNVDFLASAIRSPPLQCIFYLECYQCSPRRRPEQRSTVVAVTIKLNGNSWVGTHGYQIMDRSQHTNIKFVKCSHVDKFFKRSFFKSPNELPDQIYEVDMSKTGIERREPIIVGFFILLYAKITMLQVKQNFLSCLRSKQICVD